MQQERPYWKQYKQQREYFTLEIENYYDLIVIAQHYDMLSRRRAVRDSIALGCLF